MTVDSVQVLTGVHPRHRRLPEEVASFIRELIMSGAVRPGEFLRMDAIARKVGVSTTPVREALLILRGQGFVRLLPRRGFVVSPFTQQDVRDLFLAQAALAGELAARAAQNVAPEHLTQLDQIVRDYEAAVEADDKTVVIELSHTYHRGINLAANSNGLASLLDSVVRVLPSRFYATIDGWIDETRREHPVIIDALRSRDSAKARHLMERHISFGADRLIDTLKARGLWGKPTGG